MFLGTDSFKGFDLSFGNFRDDGTRSVSTRVCSSIPFHAATANRFNISTSDRVYQGMLPKIFQLWPPEKSGNF